MHQRTIAAVAGALFALLAVVSGVMTDLHDRSYPHALGATSVLSVDTAPSGMDDDRAFTELARLSHREGLRLVRVLPDLAGDADGQVFVPIGSAADGLPTRVPWYGDQPDGVVRSVEALANSYASGQYLVTGDRSRLGAAVEELASQGVVVRRVDDTVLSSASFLVRQESFRTTVLAGTALMIAMALFWLSARARGRALRVLGGVPAWRIQVEDLGRFAVAVSVPALPVALVALVVVRVRHGAASTPYYAATLLGLQVGVLLVALLCALLLSTASWPAVRLIASRRPAVQSLSRASTVLRLTALLLVLLTAGPAWTAYRDASAAAAQEAQWRSLADQVALRYPSGLGEEGFVAVSKGVGSLVADAERKGTASLSYAVEPEQIGLQDSAFDQVVLVNSSWLRLVGASADGTGPVVLEPVTRDAATDVAGAALAPDLDLWARAPRTGSDLWEAARLLTTAGHVPVPVAAGGSGDLVFPDHPLLVVLPHVAAGLDDDFLASAASTSNVVFTGVDATTGLLRRHGLTTLQVKHAAEDGVLRAQYAAYDAWLRGVALVALAGAFVLALIISALISALVHARRDFPLRLSGRAWREVLRPRVQREWCGALVLGALVVLLQGSTSAGPVLAALVLALAGTAAGHLGAVRWTFARVADRAL